MSGLTTDKLIGFIQDSLAKNRPDEALTFCKILETKLEIQMSNFQTETMKTILFGEQQHLDVLYPPEQVPYRDTLGRLKFQPIEQKTECVHLCSCCKVIE